MNVSEVKTFCSGYLEKAPIFTSQNNSARRPGGRCVQRVKKLMRQGKQCKVSEIDFFKKMLNDNLRNWIIIIHESSFSEHAL